MSFGVSTADGFESGHDQHGHLPDPGVYTATANTSFPIGKDTAVGCISCCVPRPSTRELTVYRGVLGMMVLCYYINIKAIGRTDCRVTCLVPR